MDTTNPEKPAENDTLTQRRALLRATLAGGAVVATIRPSLALAASGMNCDIKISGGYYTYKKNSGSPLQHLLFKNVSGQNKAMFYNLDYTGTGAIPTIELNTNSGTWTGPSTFTIPKETLDTAIPQLPGSMQQHEINLVKLTQNPGGITASGCATSFVGRVV